MSLNFTKKIEPALAVGVRFAIVIVIMNHQRTNQTARLIDFMIIDKEEVDATILQNDDISVSCEVNLQAGQIHINLPRSIFPEKIYYGMPVIISYKEVSGMRQPIITPRNINIESMQKENNEISAIIEKL